LTSCLSSICSELSELTSLFPFGKAKIIIHGNLSKQLFSKETGRHMTLLYAGVINFK
jgi:hypothetical protein